MGGAINITTATPRKPLEGHIAYSQGFARGADYAHNMSARLGARTEYGFIQIGGSQLQQRFTPYLMQMKIITRWGHMDVVVIQQQMINEE